MAAKTLTIDGKQVSADESATILEAATDAGITIPTLCHLDGVYDVGACRLCPAAPGLHHEGERGHGHQNGQRAAAQIPADDAGAAVRRAEPRVRGLRGQRPLRAAEAGLQPRDGSRPLRGLDR